MTDTPETPDTARMVAGNDAMNHMIQIFLSGFLSGATSALETCTGATEEQAADVAQRLTAGLQADPLLIEEVRQAVHQMFLELTTYQVVPRSAIPTSTTDTTTED